MAADVDRLMLTKPDADAAPHVWWFRRSPARITPKGLSRRELEYTLPTRRQDGISPECSLRLPASRDRVSTSGA
jgi:hypothetical protein